jgi:hypothetical protein
MVLQAFQEQQTRFVARARRAARDAVLGQREVELVLPLGAVMLLDSAVTPVQILLLGLYVPLTCLLFIYG